MILNIICDVSPSPGSPLQLQLLAVAASILLNVEQLDPYQRGLARYQLRAILPWDLAGADLEGDETFEIPCASLPVERCAELRRLADHAGALDPDRAESLWARLYPETRAERGDETLIPATLAAFRARLAYETWPVEVVAESRVKRAKRVIFRGQAADGRRVSVSETHTATGEVRETEVAVSGKAPDGDDDYHFYVYDAAGRLVRQSEFPAGLRPAPEICVACHANFTTGRIDRFFPPH